MKKIEIKKIVRESYGKIAKEQKGYTIRGDVYRYELAHLCDNPYLRERRK